LAAGPGFFAALRKQDFNLTPSPRPSYYLGVALAVALGWLLKMDFAAVLGMLSGATTNTPSLVRRTADRSRPARRDRRSARRCPRWHMRFRIRPRSPAYRYAARDEKYFRIDPAKEAEAFAAEQRGRVEPLENRHVDRGQSKPRGPRHRGDPLARRNRRDRFPPSRAGEPKSAWQRANTILQRGDCIVGGGAPAMLDRFQHVVGRRSEEDLRLVPAM